MTHPSRDSARQGDGRRRASTISSTRSARHRPAGSVEHLREYGLHFDAIYCGPLARQVDTLAHMQSAAAEVGAAWPRAVILAELAEAPIEVLARHCMTERLATDVKLQGIMSEAVARARAPDDNAFFEAVLAHVVCTLGERRGDACPAWKRRRSSGAACAPGSIRILQPARKDVTSPSSPPTASSVGSPDMPRAKPSPSARASFVAFSTLR